MLRNRPALSALQKTYDESYLTCSTAVYYESQGNEEEALRCWKLALDQIYEHNASRSLPSRASQSETERALVDSLQELELQCKERIDLLEALRISRLEQPPQGDAVSPSLDGASTQPSRRILEQAGSQEAGWIGGGTIPAITYPELSKPTLPQRPSISTRTSSEQAVVGSRDAGFSMGDRYLSDLGNAPRPPPRPTRSPSPERRTMRTTLRSGRLGDKSLKPSSKRSTPRPAEGPSKAASLAWSAISRDKAGESSSGSLANSTIPTTQWDIHSRRLVSRPGGSVSPSDERRSFDLSTARHSEELSRQPSQISISAASSALGALSVKEQYDSDHIPRLRTAPPQPIAARAANHGYSRGEILLADEDTDILERRKSSSDAPGHVRRKPVVQPRPGSGPDVSLVKARHAHSPNSPEPRRARGQRTGQASTSSADESTPKSARKTRGRRRKDEQSAEDAESDAEASEGSDLDEDARTAKEWKKRKATILKSLPPGVDEHAAKQILNDIVVRGDEVRWGDVAGLQIAKNALREAVVYPFLRPDLFKGLREPARGMLLFGPPGTGKTMLARAVATESKSTFFSISASSLTSKYLGESEKLVRALFGLAKILAPSIIFVDEIDSLLSQRSGSGEHEATMRIKTEFLIQWSDLQRAAAGRDSGDKERGDANRVLVLAATNLPWAIDEAARRRFVRRQYIPLPEEETRATQLRNLLGHQKHVLTDSDIEELVKLTDGFSGSDITALAKDAAMGPLRSLGEALLLMSMDEIRPIELADFQASLTNIRPSVSKTGLKEYEDWAREFGERGG